MNKDIIESSIINNPNELKKLSEIELFLTIENLITTIFASWHVTNDDGKPIDLTPGFTALQFCAYETRKFGVEMPDAQSINEVEFTSSYEAWYDFWRNHFENMDEDELMRFEVAVQSGEDISGFSPKVSFKDGQEKNKIFIKK